MSAAEFKHIFWKVKFSLTRIYASFSLQEETKSISYGNSGWKNSTHKNVFFSRFRIAYQFSFVFFLVFNVHVVASQEGRQSHSNHLFWMSTFLQYCFLSSFSTYVSVGARDTVEMLFCFAKVALRRLLVFSFSQCFCYYYCMCVYNTEWW